MVYKSYPWHCSVCNRDFQGGMGKASHYRGKPHKQKLAELSEGRAETLIRGFAALNRGELVSAERYLEESESK